MTYYSIVPHYCIILSFSTKIDTLLHQKGLEDDKNSFKLYRPQEGIFFCDF